MNNGILVNRNASLILELIEFIPTAKIILVSSADDGNVTTGDLVYDLSFIW